MAIIDDIKNRDGETVYPRTVNGAVYDSDTNEPHHKTLMPHQFTDGAKTFKWGFRTKAGQPQFIYEEVF